MSTGSGCELCKDIHKGGSRQACTCFCHHPEIMSRPRRKRKNGDEQGDFAVEAAPKG